MKTLLLGPVITPGDTWWRITSLVAKLIVAITLVCILVTLDPYIILFAFLLLPVAFGSARMEHPAHRAFAIGLTIIVTYALISLDPLRPHSFSAIIGAIHTGQLWHLTDQLISLEWRNTLTVALPMIFLIVWSKSVDEARRHLANKANATNREAPPPPRRFGLLLSRLSTFRYDPLTGEWQRIIKRGNRRTGPLLDTRPRSARQKEELELRSQRRRMLIRWCVPFGVAVYVAWHLILPLPRSGFFNWQELTTVIVRAADAIGHLLGTPEILTLCAMVLLVPAYFLLVLFSYLNFVKPLFVDIIYLSGVQSIQGAKVLDPDREALRESFPGTRQHGNLQDDEHRYPLA
jgi:hypothetical protein